MSASRGFYVRKVQDHPDPLYPVYELLEDGGLRLVASRIGALDHVWPPDGKPLPDWMVRAGDTLEEAIAFGKTFYRKSQPVPALQPAAERSDGDNAHDAPPHS